ncbi:MAG TPA: DNA recombination protein RmuC [Mycobacteriales bacterium]|jgi:DNA recombination protein RmuC|nr:DNA recombination protein RmuC [Mycobacteriales bacterium]
MDVVVASLATLVVGLTVGWLVARARISSGMTAVRRERDAASTERDTARAERDGARAEREGLRSERDAAAQRAGAAEIELAATGARLAALAEAEQQLKDTFARMSTEALLANRQQFLDLADDRFKQAGRPLTETLGKMEAQLRDIEQKREGAQATLSEQISFVRLTGEQLRSETAALVGALRKPQARGRWGELQLKRCVELAGMTDRCDYVEQHTLATSDGALRPDMIVRLVGGKNIVIDSKVTLAAYLEAHESADEAVRDERLAAHARHLRQHVDSLAAKAYWCQLSPTPEFVVLFIPGDSFLAAALDQDPALLDYAFEKRVHIASPTTLISVLRTVAYSWQQEALAKNAQAVFDLGKELYQRLGKFGGHMSKLGNSLTSAVKVYNDSVGSLERNVLSTARKLSDMEIVDEPLKEIDGIEETIRPLAKPELVESAEADRTIRAVTSAGTDLDRIDDYGINPGNPIRDRRTGS